MDINQYIDLDTALGRVRGNKAIYTKMLQLFCGSEEFASLDAALEAGDWAKASEVAHGIKGMTGNLGFTPLFETSTRLMETLRAGPPAQADLDAYRAALEGTRQSVQQLMAEWAAE